MTDTQVTQKAPSLRLVVDERPHGHESATLPIRWCISPEMQQEIIDRRLEDPCILIVVTNGTQEIHRVVRPLTTQMAYVQVPRAGKTTIYGAIVYRTRNTKELLRALERNRSETLVESERPGERKLTEAIDGLQWKIEAKCDDLGVSHWNPKDHYLATPKLKRLVASRERLIEQREQLIKRVSAVAVLDPWRIEHVFDARCLATDSFDVDIPEFLFAKERPWMKKVGSLLPWWHRPARDQCDLRNRVLWTLIGSPVWIAGGLIVGVLFAVWWVIGKLVIAVWTGLLLFCGFRGINFDPLLVPGNLHISEVHENRGSSIWTTKRVKGKYHPVSRGPIFYVLNPVTVTIFVLSAWALSMFGAWLVWLPVGVFLLALVVVPGVMLLNAHYAKEEEKRDAERLDRFQRGLQQVTCDTGGACIEAKIDALPKERRTLYLKFWDLKSQVCKPFAR